jgi:hypothetical protein
VGRRIKVSGSKVERAYLRSTLVERRAIMDAWARSAVVEKPVPSRTA